MSVKKDIKEIKEILERLDKDTLTKAKKYVELIDQLNSIKFTARPKHFLDDNGNCCVLVEYSISPEKIMLDSNGNVAVSDTFKNINLLNLISFEDMQRITDAISAAEQKNKT